MESWWARLLSLIWAGFALTLAGLLFFAAIYPLLRKASAETALA
jgi:predicted HTH transcriptional regulator